MSIAITTAPSPGAITPEIVDVIQFTDAEKREARNLRNDLHELIGEIGRHEKLLSENWMTLGVSLHRVRSKKFWHLWGFASFPRYIETVKDKLQKGRTQLYQYIGVAEHLLPNGISETQLIAMGPTKASELKRIVKSTGRRPSTTVIEKAVNPNVSIQELRAVVFEEHHVKTEDHGKYFELGGFYATPDEKQEILEAFDVATKTDPVIQHDLPEWVRRKEIILRMSREYMSTYAAAVGQGVG